MLVVLVMYSFINVKEDKENIVRNVEVDKISVKRFDEQQQQRSNNM